MKGWAVFGDRSDSRIRSLGIRHGCCLLLLLGIGGCEFGNPAEPAIEAVKIEMTGYQFRWHSRYPGDDGQWGTSDDLHAAQVLHVPLKADVEIVLKSRDYI